MDLQQQGKITIFNNSSSPVETASELKIIEKVEKSKEDYHRKLLKEQVRRQNLVNDWIDDLTIPLLKEVNAKNTF